jgi:hypothetical protein
MKGVNIRTPAVITMARKSDLFFLQNTIENTDNENGINPIAAVDEYNEGGDEIVRRVSSILFWIRSRVRRNGFRST